MTDVKRIEIVVDAAHTPTLLDVLKVAGMTGYTLLRDVQGSGDRGDRSGDGLGNVYRNCYLVTAVPEDLAMPLAEAVRPLLKRYGGVCLISDAMMLRH